MPRLGTNTFLRRCGGISTTLRNKLEQLGVIHPECSDAGWRTYSEADVMAAKRWIATQGRRVRR